MREASLIQHLSDASQYISQQTTDTDEIKEYLDSIAVLRFVLGTAADILYNNRSPSSPITNALLDKTKAICTAATSASAEHCVLYLIKVIVRRYGLSSLKQIARNYSWVVPDDLMNEVCINICMSIHTEKQILYFPIIIQCLFQIIEIHHHYMQFPFRMR